MSPATHDNSAPSNPAPPIIGIVGGVGPFAGLDLQRKVLEETMAARDQDHLPVITISWPRAIPDRTEYLLGQITENPADAIVAQLRLLAGMGAAVAGIPCNTAHAPAIFNVIRARVAAFQRPLRLLHMIDETVAHLADHHPTRRTIGILSTTGAWQVRLYPAALEPLGYHTVAPDETMQVATIHRAIYDPGYGIKAAGGVTARARAGLEQGAAYVCQRGAEAIILGCTEMPLAFTEPEFDGRPLIDPTRVLARALIRAVAPHQLKA
ncbi:MAG: aspartate/glutamate racemase family protein [Anaerolineae bacterium]|uniref:aspartate/glutamate racemase family protein n=1 Tax=Promineifilum sp. TaxID=2664178 RepID=UPI001DE38459|nr:aspartate/glutamate racemase family protein [Anaerolineales bacterium]MCB8934492.1 aspartate/glutamate racemase family protein [Promineifilum sp.]MCO5179938.1 amino acid racemase [Promineifilum sp.]MCW5847098.1 aspartate/glutamate racemase family protein [Anaerolineae bacterium]